MKRYCLTTIDNPYNPVEDFSNWWAYDMHKGYSSCCLLSRIAKTSDSLTDEENEAEISRAIDEIIKYDFQNIYTRFEYDDEE